MTVPYKTMNDGFKIPQLGFGVYQITDDNSKDIISSAINSGYRHIDTAKIYINEATVGAAIQESTVAREDIFLTTKLWNDDHGFDSTLYEFDKSLKRLQTDYIDLYLIHWPVPSRDKFVETWRAFIRLREEKRVRSIGVSNFRIVDLERIIKETGVYPAINQVELHPFFQQRELRIFHEKNNILTEAWSPLARAQIFDNPQLNNIAKAHGKTVAQVILRWHMENGIIAIPKSQSKSRLRENLDIFDFQLTARDHDVINTLDTLHGRTGTDPAIM